ncbi:hypothetical protein Lp19_2521 [Lactiplantibacillus plantarum]|uniref:Uncharacterized protein n=1 Tax=Lactiplantibacillus plantarum TaxID=1590 RepID=A0A165RKI0_LACPN|nr:hypothetical protein Lp19_2521 [Lactiplantibacillus plantarum]
MRLVYNSILPVFAVKLGHKDQKSPAILRIKKRAATRAALLKAKLTEEQR